MFIGCTLWSLWLTRNEGIFNKETPKVEAVIARRNNLHKDWMECFKTKRNSGSNQDQFCPIIPIRDLQNGYIPLWRENDQSPLNQILYLGIGIKESWPLECSTELRNEERTIASFSEPFKETSSQSRHSKEAFNIFLEALLTGLLLTKKETFHSLIVVTDAFFSHVWHRRFADIARSQVWKELLKDIANKAQGIWWKPTNYLCTNKLFDDPVLSISVFCNRSSSM